MARVAKSSVGKKLGKVKRNLKGIQRKLKVISNRRKNTKPKIGPDECEARVYLKKTEHAMAKEIAKSLGMSFSEYARSLIVYGGVSNINRKQDWIPAPREGEPGSGTGPGEGGDKSDPLDGSTRER